MAHRGNSNSTVTKSIDVGGVFLMDLSVNDSEFDHELVSAAAMVAPPAELAARNRAHHQPSLTTTHIKTTTDHNQHNHNHHHHHHQDKSIRLGPSSFYNNSNSNHHRAAALPGTQQQQQPPAAANATTRSSQHKQEGYLDNSLDRSASVINCDVMGQQQQQQEHEQILTTNKTKTSGQCEVIVIEQQAAYELEAQSSLSLSDESFVASSGTSLSGTSLTGSGASSSDECCEAAAAAEVRDAAGEDLDREFILENDNYSNYDCDGASTTTREDSGVLDMKDLQDGGSGQVAAVIMMNSQRQEKSISANFMATNLISSTLASGNNNNNNMNFQYQQQANSNNKINYNNAATRPQLLERSITKPTDGSNNNYHNHNHHHHHHHHHNSTNSRNSNHHHSSQLGSNSNKRSISASLPIQVPARQMKRNLNRMKLNLLIKAEEEAEEQQQQQQQQQNKKSDDGDQEQQTQQQGDELSSSSPVRRGDRNRPAMIENIGALYASATALDDDKEFLEQEFNANHHNHYPIDELESEHLTAGEDPMRLFASIQALAKSLHEDAELFGSLPPKRMLESPIRSLALV